MDPELFYRVTMATQSMDTQVLTANDFNEDPDVPEHPNVPGERAVRIPDILNPCVGLPAYEQYPSTAPPAYNTVDPKASFAHCNCHSRRSGGDNAQPTGCSKNRITWCILHLAFLGLIIGVMASTLAASARLALTEGYGDIVAKYERITFIMHTIGSVIAIPGILLFYVLFFNGRLQLNRTKSSSNTINPTYSSNVTSLS